MQNKDELDLIALAQQGDEEAFNELYNRYAKTMQYMAYRILNNHHDAQDAVQMAFVQMHRSIKDLKCPQYFRLWMNRIIAGKCNSIYRKKQVVTVDMDNYVYGNRLVEHHRDNLPQTHMKFQSDKELVDHLIMKLPYEQRLAIVLFYFQGLSLQEITDITHEPLGTIKSRLHFAKKTLRKQLESYESREGMSVNFHSLDKLLTMCLLDGAITISNRPFQHFISRSKSFFTTGTGKVIAAGMALSLTSVTVLGIQQLTQKQPTSVVPKQISNNEQATSKEQDAFFTLLNWAGTAEIISHHDKAESNEVQKEYDYLKSQQGVYWKELETRGWTTAYENFIK